MQRTRIGLNGFLVLILTALLSVSTPGCWASGGVPPELLKVWQAYRQAVAAGDSDQVAALSRFPIASNDFGGVIQSPAVLRERFQKSSARRSWPVLSTPNRGKRPVFQVIWWSAKTHWRSASNGIMVNIVLATLTMPTRNERTCLDQVRGLFADLARKSVWPNPTPDLAELEAVFEEAAPNLGYNNRALLPTRHGKPEPS